MKKLFLMVCFLTLFMCSSQIASACECIQIALTAWGELQSSDVVFAGKVMEVQEIQIPSNVAGTYTIELEVRFRVNRRLKGVAVKEVVLRANPGFGGDCGIPFKKGERYLVYANEFNGKLQTSGCTRTKLLKYAAADLKEMKEGVELKIQKARVEESLR